jgi:Protein of unknown function (DUF3102)
MSQTPTAATGDNRLAVLAAEVRTAHAGVLDAAKTVAERSVEAGKALIEAKSLVKHGEWLPWLKDHCQISERTAQLYMHVAKLGLDSQTVAEIGLRTLANTSWVIRSEHYDPFDRCTEQDKRDWLLFALLVRWPHVEWLRNHQWATPDEWLGPEGAAYRLRLGRPEPSAGFRAYWHEFRNAKGNLSLADIEAELTANEIAAEERDAANVNKRARRRLRPKSATVADLPSDLEQMAAKLREAGWAVREPTA